MELIGLVVCKDGVPSDVPLTALLGRNDGLSDDQHLSDENASTLHVMKWCDAGL